MNSERHRVNAPLVVWEDFGDEVVIVNLESGQYFSARGVGAYLWRYLAKGASLSDLLEAMLIGYDVEQPSALVAIESFLGEALNQNLLKKDPDIKFTLELAATTTEKRVFSQPTLEVFSDMQDILLLDPIHEVDATGWPAERDVRAAQEQIPEA